ncbi:MAG: ATP phosphoribosyltransferase regulatory subunit [Clostridia bacterium]|nr:ATP phosphoribosyltransferase regulatory subunit [Clostridia bacterium]
MMRRDEKAVFALRELFEKYGYTRYKMSRFEEYDLYVANKDFLISDEVITFTDRSGRLLAMKPDVTLSIIKNAPDVSGEVQKVYYNENVYRVSGGTHSFREIMQTGLECIGDLSDYEIAEVVLLAAQSLWEISKDFILDISHMGLISSVLENCALSKKDKDKVVKCLQDKNAHELFSLCKSLELDKAKTNKLNSLVTCAGAPEKVYKALLEVLTEENEKHALNELFSLCKLLENWGYEGKINVDLSVGNDLKYYSGVVFKGYIEGIPASILSGGQYDKLLKKMGRKSKAIGFAVYTDLLCRLDNADAFPVIDNVILRCDNTDPNTLIKFIKSLPEEEKLLITASLPEEKRWKRLYKAENGVVNLIEENS